MVLDKNMESKLDIITLREFLEFAGCGVYFKNAPFITMNHSVLLNKVEDRQLNEWIETFNSKRLGSMSNDSDK